MLYGAAGGDDMELVPVLGTIGGPVAGGRWQVAVRSGYTPERIFDGGPALDEENGRVIGLIVHGEQDSASRTAFLIPAEELREALRAAGVEVGCEEPRLGSILAWAEKQIRPSQPQEWHSVVCFIKDYAGRLERPIPFSGRDEKLAELDAWWGSEFRSLLMVRGPGGVGKSALLLHWLERILSQGASLELVFVPVSYRWGISHEISGLRLLHSQLAALFGGLQFAAGAKPGSTEYRAKIQEGWELVRSSTSRHLLVIDGADEAAIPWLAHGVLPAEIPMNLSIVLSMGDKRQENGAWSASEDFAFDASITLADPLELQPLERRWVREALVHLGHPLDEGSEGEEILDQLYFLTEEGNPLLVNLWANELWGGWGSLPDLRGEDLRMTAPGLGGFLDHWMKGQQERWKDDGLETNPEDVDRLLSILAFADGPLRLHDLLSVEARLASANRCQDKVARQVLDGAAGVVVGGDGVGYSFVHPRLRAEFQSRAEERGLQRTSVAGAFLAWGADAVEALNTGKPNGRCPVYLLRHYMTHVMKAGLPPNEAFEGHLLALLGPAWYRASYAQEGTYSGFLSDLARIEEVAREVDQKIETLVGQVSELIRTSVGSLRGDVDAEIILTLVQSGLWSVERGLTAIRWLPDPDKLAVVKRAVENRDLSLDRETLGLAFLMSRRMVRRDSVATVEALAGLLGGPAGPLVLQTALAAVERTEDPLWQVRVLLALVKHLEGPVRQEVLEWALAASERIEKGWRQVEAVVELAVYLEAQRREEVLGRMLEVSEGIEDEWLRAEALMKAVGPLLEYPELLLRALAAAEGFESSARRTRVLVAIGTHLKRHPELLAEALAAAEHIENAEFRAEALAIVAAHMEGHPELLQRVLEAAGSLEVDRSRAWVLEAVVAQAKRDQKLLKQTMAAVQEMKAGESRARILMAVGAQLAEESRGAVLEQALSEVEGIEDEGARARMLSAVAAQLHAQPALLERALVVAEGIGADWLRQGALAALKGDVQEQEHGHGRPALGRASGPWVLGDARHDVDQETSTGYFSRHERGKVRALLSKSGTYSALELHHHRRQIEDSEQARGEPVHVTTMAPGAVKPGARFLVAVVLHVEGFDLPETDKRTAKENTSVLSLREGVVLTVRLAAVDEEVFSIDDSEARLVWGPPSRRVEFRLRTAEELTDGTYDLRVEYWCEGVQLARTYLEVVVDRGPLGRTRVPALNKTQLPRSGFASYSRTDRARVAERVDSLKAAGIEVFLDCLDIQQGSDWQRVLEFELLSREALFLFWSTAARKSEWVEKEWRFALERRGLDFIVPNALEPPTTCPPPPELAALQFGSILTVLAQQWAAEGPQR